MSLRRRILVAAGVALLTGALGVLPAFRAAASWREALERAQAAPREGRFVRAGDVELFVQELGPPDGPPALFLQAAGQPDHVRLPTSGGKP